MSTDKINFKELANYAAYWIGTNLPFREIYFDSNRTGFMYDNNNNRWVRLFYAAQADEIILKCINSKKGDPMAEEFIPYLSDPWFSQTLRESLRIVLFGISYCPTFVETLDSMDLLAPIDTNKVIDLTTGKISDRTKEHLFTMCYWTTYSSYDENSLVSDFLNKLTCGDTEMLNNLQEMCGYFMSGRIDDIKGMFFVGNYDSGMDILSALIKTILCRYEYMIKKIFFSM